MHFSLLIRLQTCGSQGVEWGGLKENGTVGSCLSAWCSVHATVWEGLKCDIFVGGVSLRVGFEVSKGHGRLSFSPHNLKIGCKLSAASPAPGLSVAGTLTRCHGNSGLTPWNFQGLYFIRVPYSPHRNRTVTKTRSVQWSLDIWSKLEMWKC